MADPTVKDITQGQWEKVATAVTQGMISKLNWGFDYYQTYRDTGGSAPTAIVATKVPQEAVPMFVDFPQDIVVSSAAIDIYICCFVKDNGYPEQGRVRVDV